MKKLTDKQLLKEIKRLRGECMEWNSICIHNPTLENKQFAFEENRQYAAKRRQAVERGLMEPLPAHLQ